MGMKHVSASRPVEQGSPSQHRILMVSDFFFPNFGGVESHIFCLSQCLMALGHKVVVLTHAYGERCGVRYMTNGLKVYYCPRYPFYQGATVPIVWLSLPLVRRIVTRERISVIHGHQAFSPLCHEAILHGRAMGIPTVFTDHSLDGFTGVSSIHMNKVLQFSMAAVQHALCVSFTCKENTVLRSGSPPHRVSVIPNAVDATVFMPDPAQKDKSRVTVVVVSRLAYRKGADLLAEVIPKVCETFPQVNFLIAGDGAKKVLLEEMVDKHSLHARLKMLGAVAHADVHPVLVKGDIFLNCSLTEAFCIAIVEAACCGLMVVSTRVGGVPEVLPPEMMVLAEPNSDSLAAAVAEAVDRLPALVPWRMHEQVQTMYSWHDVARRTEIVYNEVSALPADSFQTCFNRYLACGPFAGPLFCFVFIVECFFLSILEWIQPASGIEVVPGLCAAYSAHKPKSEHDYEGGLQQPGTPIEKGHTTRKQEKHVHKPNDLAFVQ